MRKAFYVFIVGSILVIIYNISQINPNQHYVNGKGGGYYRTNPNSTTSDNKNTNFNDIIFGIFAVGIGTIILFGSVIPWVEENILGKGKEEKKREIAAANKERILKNNNFSPEELKLLNYDWKNMSELLKFQRNESNQNTFKITSYLYKAKYNFFKTRLRIYFMTQVAPKVEFFVEFKASEMSLDNSKGSINNLMRILNYTELEIENSKYDYCENVFFKIGTKISLEVFLNRFGNNENQIFVLEFNKVENT